MALSFYAAYELPGTEGFHTTHVVCGQISSVPDYIQYSTYSQPYGSMLRSPNPAFNNRTQYLDAPSTSIWDIYRDQFPNAVLVGDIDSDTVIDFYYDENGQTPMGMKLYIEDDGTNYKFYLANKKYGLFYNCLEYALAKTSSIPNYDGFTGDNEAVKNCTFNVPYAYHECTSWEEVFAQMIVDLYTDYEAETYEYLPMALEHAPILFGYPITHRYWQGGDNYIAIGGRGQSTPNIYYRSESYRGLNTIGNWLLFMVDKFIYAENEPVLHDAPLSKVIKFDLKESMNGISEIVLAKACYFTDDFYVDSGYQATAGIAFKEIVGGTDLLELIDHDLSQDHVITLKNDDTITIKTTGDVIFEAAGKKLSFQYANRTGGSPFDNVNNGWGIFLVCPYSFEEIDTETWMDELQDYSEYEYGNAPFCLASYVGIPNPNQPLQTYFWNDTLHPSIGPAGYVTEYTFSYYDTSLIDTIETDANTAFWAELLQNLHSEEPEPPAPYDPGTGSIGGGTSGPGGGNGEYDDSGDSVGAGIPPALLAPQTSHMYRATNADLSSIMSFINNTSEEEVRSKYIGSVMNISLVGIPKSWSMSLGTAEDFKLAGTDTGVDLQPLRTQFLTGSLGTFKIDEYFGTFLDYDPYTKIQIYLPYVGFTDLSANEIIGNECELVASIDLMSGLIQYQLMSKDANTGRNIVILSVNGQCASQYPLTALDYNGKVMSIVGTIAGAITFGVGIASILASGGSTAPLVAGIMATVGGASATMSSGMAASRASKGTTVRSGATAGCTGHMSVHRPYIIISRPKQNIPETFGHEYGFKSHISARLGDLTGFTKVEDIHLENMGDITQDELEELESILKSGIIL